MSTPAQRGARAALDAARPAIARLDIGRGSEDLAADLIETWSAIEAALRALVGSSVLTGQALIREARQRQLINFDQANALAEFQAVHDRVQDTAYRPTDADINAARAAYLKLDTASMGDLGIELPRVPMQDRAASAPLAAAAAAEPAEVAPPPRPRRFPLWALVLGVVVIAAVAVGAYYAFSGGDENAALQQGIDAYRRGQREAAVSAFNKAVRDDPHASLPHIYLARMAREVGNFSLASQELQLALQADPNSATALREMGANLLAQRNYELARRFYVRAVQADPTDKTAQGYLGCTLMRLNRVQEATNFLSRAGQGPWSNCTPAVPANPNPAALGTRALPPP